MANTFVASRAHVIWGVCLPLAILLGYLLADPVDSGSLAVFVLLAAVLCVPLLLKWHHPLLILTWNAAIMPSFFPGMMSLWMALAMVTFAFGLLNRATSPENKFLCPIPVTAALIFLAVVVVGTMISTGGIGARAFNSAKYGGKGYFHIGFAIIGFFALCSQKIPRKYATFFAGAYFLSGFTEAMSDLIYLAGPKAYGLFSIFPMGNATSLAAAEQDLALQDNIRIGGFGLAMVAVVTGMLAMFGVRGVLDFKRPWRGLVLMVAIVAGTYSGFRSMLLLSVMALVVVFFMEGLHRTRIVFVVAGLAAVLVGLLAVYASDLPMPVQRAISFLPVDVNPMVRHDAQNSVDWRVDMWRSLLPEVPQYWLMGKGYLVDANALSLGFESLARGLGSRWEAAALAGDYHNGPLSLMIPLGGLGVAAFLCFLAAGGRVLWLNYRHGDAELIKINRFLLAYFGVRIVYFIFVFGSFYQDLFVFTGMVGMSLSLNGGVRRGTAVEPVPTPEAEGLAWNDYPQP
jgi:hypothetical protein